MRFVGKGVCVPRVQKGKEVGETSIHKAKDNRRHRSQLSLRIASQSIAYRFASLQCMRAQERGVLFCLSRTGPTDLLCVLMGRGESVS
jgi:hypothetical protein